MTYYITGDTHGQVLERLAALPYNCEPSETALIILGDCGLNFFLNNTDTKNKISINDTGYIVYCVRGNHEERPENIPTMESWYDTEIEGEVWREPQFPNIRYLKDGGEYVIDGLRTLVVGGAYSVDKWYRLSKASANAKWTGWFKDELLTADEMREITDRVAGRSFDLVLSHTCPFSLQPFDLFLPFVNQDEVDKTTELWLEELSRQISYSHWFFGHFHADRQINERVRMFFYDILQI